MKSAQGASLTGDEAFYFRLIIPFAIHCVYMIVRQNFKRLCTLGVLVFTSWSGLLMTGARSVKLIL